MKNLLRNIATQTPFLRISRKYLGGKWYKVENNEYAGGMQGAINTWTQDPLLHIGDVVEIEEWPIKPQTKKSNLNTK